MSNLVCVWKHPGHGAGHAGGPEQCEVGRPRRAAEYELTDGHPGRTVMDQPQEPSSTKPVMGQRSGGALLP